MCLSPKESESWVGCMDPRIASFKCSSGDFDEFLCLEPLA